MDRIQGPHTTPDRRFTDGDPASGLQATEVSAQWLNGVQEELVGIIEEASLVPNPSATDQLLKALMSLAHPVGSIYIHADPAVNPFQLFGVGTWIEISKGRVPVGLDLAVTEFNAVGKQGGALTATAATTIPNTGWQVPGGSLPRPSIAGALVAGSGGNEVGEVLESLNHIVASRSLQSSNFPILQPYEVVGRIWKRIA